MDTQNAYANHDEVPTGTATGSSSGHDAPPPLAASNAMLRWVERAFAAVAAAMLLAIMLIATCDVVLRYFFNSPLGWSYDVISLYLMAGVFFLALAETLERNAHVAVDLLHSHLPDRLRHAALLPGYALAAIVLCAVTWLATQRAVESYTNGDVIAGRFDWPTWISAAFVAVGFAILTLRVVYRLVGHAASAIRGRAAIQLPPIAGSEH
jgi:TRAP-type C4-dicarboxylate transport system permease small subunit